MCAVWVASRSGQALPASVVKLRRKPVSVLSLNAVRVSLQFCTSLLVGLRVSEVFSYLPKILISEEVWSRQTEAIICLCSRDVCSDAALPCSEASGLCFSSHELRPVLTNLLQLQRRSRGVMLGPEIQGFGC